MGNRDGANLKSQTRMEAWGKSHLQPTSAPAGSGQSLQSWQSGTPTLLAILRAHLSHPQRLRPSESSSQSSLVIPPQAHSPVTSDWASEAQSQVIYGLAHSRGGERPVFINTGRVAGAVGLDLEDLKLKALHLVQPY